MKVEKAIELRVDVPGSGDTTRDAFEKAFAQANPDLKLSVLNWPSPDATGVAHVDVRIEGEQEVTDDFEELAKDALQKALTAIAPQTRGLEPSAPANIEEAENTDEDIEQYMTKFPPTAPPTTRAPVEAPPPQPTPRKPRNTSRWQKTKPPPTTFHGCPAAGTGGDPLLNTGKNRTDTGRWHDFDVQDILNLPNIANIPTRRAQWTPQQQATIAKYEGLPVMVEGYLLAVKPEKEESCNCYIKNDLDSHLLLIDDPNKKPGDAVVCEISPRVRANHPAWTNNRIRAIDRTTKIRLSGWLLYDQMHNNLIGKSRGTLWEIHPIIAFEVQRNNTWIALDQDQVTRDLEETAPTMQPEESNGESSTDASDGASSAAPTTPENGGAGSPTAT